MEAFESLPSYRATKSDYYTHVMDIPPQYGPGYRVLGQEALRMAAAIDGSDGSWSLPLPPFNVSKTCVNVSNLQTRVHTERTLLIFITSTGIPVHG